MYESFLGVNPWTALFILLNTLTIYFVGRKYLFAPVMKIIEDRQQEIDDLYSTAEQAQSAAQTMESEYRQKLNQARITSERIIQEAESRGQSREHEIIRSAREQATAIMDKSVADIAAQKEKAIHDAKAEISILAVAIAGKVLERELNGASHSKLIDGFIHGLGDKA